MRETGRVGETARGHRHGDWVGSPPAGLRRPGPPGGEVQLRGFALSYSDPYRRDRAPGQSADTVPAGLLAHDQGEVGEMGLRLVSLLGSQPRSRTWLAVGPEGEVRVARRLPERPLDEVGRVADVLIRMVALRDPSFLGPTALLADRETWVVRRFGAGVPLRRLLMVVGLSPRQLGALVRDIAAALATLHGSGVAHGVMHPGNVIVGVDGRARLCDAGTRPGGDAPIEARRDLDDLREVVTVGTARWSGQRRRAPVSGARADADRALRDAVTGTRLAEDGAALLHQLDAAMGEPPPAVRRELSLLVERLTPRAVTPAR